MSSLITAISFARESNVWDKNEYTLDVQVEANAANAQRDGLLRNPDRILAMLTESHPADRESLETEIEAMGKAEQLKLTELKRLAGRLRTAPDSVAEHIEREMQSVEAERRTVERQIAELRRQIAARQSRESGLTALTDLVDAVADKIADAPLWILAR